MANSTISLSFKITEGANSLKQLTVDAEGLKKVMEANVTEADKLRNTFVGFSALANSIDAVSNTLGQLNAYLTDLTDAMAAQQVAETQLAVTMQNSMHATEGEIQAIKDLCSAQQQIGVVGDEVQLAGAQKMATYLKERDSIEKLIPAMNDMMVAQKGLEGTQQDAATIAAMFGKAMAGQTTGFKRMGWELTAAQEQILKFGTEQQKVAAICSIVESRVGGMNEALAKTESGMIQQSKNMTGDWKEQWGSMAAAIAPTVTILASVTVTLGGLTKVGMGIAAVTKTVATFSLGTKAATLILRALGFEVVKGAGFFSTFSKSAQVAVTSTRLLGAAFRSLLITSGVGIAVWALSEVIGYFTSSADKAEDATNNLIDAQKAAEREAERQKQSEESLSRTMTDVRAALELNIARTKDFHGTKAEEQKIVNELNDTYGTTMGYFSSVADWYNALITNSEKYCKQMEIEAQTRIIADRIAQRKEEMRSIDRDEKGNKRRYSTAKHLVSDTYIDGKNVKDMGAWEHFKAGLLPSGHSKTVVHWSKSEGEEAQEAYDELAAKNKADREYMESLVKQQAGITFDVVGSPIRPGTTPTHKSSTPAKKDPQWRDDAKSKNEISENIKILQKQKDDARSFAEAEALQKDIDLWQKRFDIMDKAGKKADEQKKNPLEGFTINPASLKTLEDYQKQIQALQHLVNTAESDGARTMWNQQLEYYEKLYEYKKNLGKTKTDTGAPVLNSNATTLKDIEGNISYWQELLNGANVAEAAAINGEIAMWQKKADAIRNAGKEVKATFENFRSGWSSIKGVGSGVESITKALEGNGNAWQTLTGIVDGFFQIYDGISGIVELIQMLTAATQASSTAKTEENVNTAVGIGLKSAETEVSQQNMLTKQGEAIANATSSGAKLPFPANVAAIAAGIAAVVSAFAMIGSFATGGIVGGNSPSGDRLLARVNSGEMILNKEQQRNLFNQLNAPLRMASVAAPAAISAPAINADAIMANRREEMKFPKIISRISGRDIVLSAANETRIASKSGRKSNIVI